MVLELKNLKELDDCEYLDYKGQVKALPILKDLFKKCKEVKFIHHIIDKGRVDIELFVTTSKGNNVKYYIECKDRWCYFDKYADEGYILEISKYDVMIKKQQDSGYIPLYLNTFKDNKYRIWDLNKIPNKKIGHIERKKKTVDPSAGTKNTPHFLLFDDDVICSGRIPS